jgi:UDP-N-acetylmuramoylalanine--D-glutamate ligase
VLDVFPDHLDEHKTLSEYYSAKANIASFQKKGDLIFYFADNKLSKSIAQKGPAKKIAVWPKENNLRKNYEMAAAVARYLGCSLKIINRTIKNFRGLEHRLELVKQIKQRTDKLKNVRVRFYNDSAATNPQTTAMAIRSFTEPAILIAGGRDAKFDYRVIGVALRRSSVKKVILFGENKRKVARQIKTGGRPIALAKNLGDALSRAYQAARVLMPPSVVILFSPGAKSFDMFHNYADRGKKFKQLVKNLK